MLKITWRYRGELRSRPRIVPTALSATLPASQNSRDVESHGDTPEEALANLRDAQRLYLESLLEDGLEPAKPIAVTEGTYSATQSVWRVEHAAESAPPNVIGGVQGITLPVMVEAQG